MRLSGDNELYYIGSQEDVEKNSTNSSSGKIIIAQNGDKIVELGTIKYKGKRTINWNAVKEELKEHIGKSYIIQETNEMINIDSRFPDELKGSNDTRTLMGMNAKAKANITQCIPLLISTATNKRHQINFKTKHNIDAKYGWNRYTCYFNIPVMNNNVLERYNEFRGELLVRCASDGNLYLYDIVNVKKR